MSALVVDEATGEISGPGAEIDALLRGRPSSAAGGSPTLDDVPWLAAAAAAARAPRLVVTLLGEVPPLRIAGDAAHCLVTTDLPGGRRTALAIPAGDVAVVLAARLGLEPRPRPAEPAIRLAPGAMATLIGRRQVHGHGLEPAVATALQRRLDHGVRHWTVRITSGERRRNLEVVDGPGGIWRVRPAEELVELAPASTTEVLRELVALLAAGDRGAARPAAP